MGHVFQNDYEMGWVRAFLQRYCVLTDWNIGVVEVSAADVADLVAHGRIGPVRWRRRLSRWRSCADPFIWRLEGGYRVLYEEIDHWARRGHIRSFSLSRFDKRRASRLEITQPHHLSYPFVLEWEGTWYCAPESAQSRGVDLYSWDPASCSWELRRRLIDNVALLDATFFRHDGLWYLFGTQRGEGPCDQLRIWWSQSLMGHWRPHRIDPAKTDRRSTRSAGPLFEFGGHWYRPAQDCTSAYGGALTINRVDVLTPMEFSETTVSRVAPDPAGPYPDGLHTLALCGDKLVVDGKRVGFCAWLPLMKAARRVARLGRGPSARLAAGTGRRA